ncbi:MAG: ECF transporter S component [Caldisericia bacterium]
MARLRDVYTLVVVSMLSALSFVGMLIQIPFWMTPWLKFDLSEIFAILGAIIYGPWIGLLIVGIKNVLHYLLKSGDVIGVTMNFFAVGTMVIIVGYAKILAERTKNLKTQYIYIGCGLIIGIIVRVIIMVPINWLAILYVPLYRDVFTADGVFNWDFARVYIYTNTTVFNGVQGLVSTAIAIPLMVAWNNIFGEKLEI